MVTGGARSGKSSYALSLGDSFSRKAYLATAQALDQEMQERIEKHKKYRDPSYVTFEAPLELPQVLLNCIPRFDFLIVDCLTFWLCNLLLSSDGLLPLEKKIESLMNVVESHHSSTLVFVSNEVGMGIVPDSQLGRQFRDLQGMLNQRVGRLADEVIFMVSGFPLMVKSKERAYENV